MVIMWWSHLLSLFVVFAIGAQGQDVESRVVQTTQGPIRGYRESNRNLFAFYSIPYATAPTARDRYKAPLSPPSWTETFEAVDKNIICPQGSLSDFMVIPGNQQEDCLIANVFVPDTNQTNLPVVVSIHGGAFQIGYGLMDNYRTFAETKNFIMVTFNHRLGVHGFLCLGTKDVPGNAGLKDQVALLRWVNKNIANFGGNPDHVTIMGCSAGSASVDLLTISDATKGLFHKAISDSSAQLSAYSVQIDPLENAKFHANILNFTHTDDLKALEEFYRDTSLNQLMRYVHTDRKDTVVIFSPCVERDVGEERVLTDAPFNILSSGEYTKYPMIYGFANMEGLMRIGYFTMWMNELNNNFSKFLPGDMKFDNDEVKEDVARRVKEFYFGNGTITENGVLAFIDFSSDTLFTISMLRSAELRIKNGGSAIYFHEYSFYDENIGAATNIRGAGHCAQSFALYDQDESNFTQEYIHMKSVMRELYYNFIATSQPVVQESSLPSWPPMGANRSPYMSLGRTLELKNSLLEDRYRLWEDLYERHYRTPTAPTPTGAASNILISKSIFIIMLIIRYVQK